MCRHLGVGLLPSSVSLVIVENDLKLLTSTLKYRLELDVGDCILCGLITTRMPIKGGLSFKCS